MAVPGRLSQPGSPLLFPPRHLSCHPFCCFCLLFPPRSFCVQEGKRENRSKLFHSTHSIYCSSYHCCQMQRVKQPFITLADPMGAEFRQGTQDGFSLVHNGRDFSWEDSETGLTQQLGARIIWRHLFSRLGVDAGWLLGPQPASRPRYISMGSPLVSPCGLVGVSQFGQMIVFQERASQKSKREVWHSNDLAWESHSVPRSVLYWSKQPQSSTQGQEEGTQTETTGWEVCQSYYKHIWNKRYCFWHLGKDNLPQ